MILKEVLLYMHANSVNGVVSSEILRKGALHCGAELIGMPPGEELKEECALSDSAWEEGKEHASKEYYIGIKAKDNTAFFDLKQWCSIDQSTYYGIDLKIV